MSEGNNTPSLEPRVSEDQEHVTSEDTNDKKGEEDGEDGDKEQTSSLFEDCNVETTKDEQEH